MAKSTKGNLIRAGLDLFCEHGFNSVGLDQILRRVGVTKTTFYNHFESKEQLICDVINIHVRERHERLLEGMNRLGGSDPRKRLLAIFEMLHEVFSDEKFCGCLIINALIEFPSPTDQVHDTARELAVGCTTFFEECAAEAGIANVKKFSLKFGMLYDGAIFARQAFGVDNAALEARDAVEILLKEA